MNTLIEWILEKRGLRHDGIWTNPVAFKSFLKVIPLYLDTFALMRTQYWPRKKLERLQKARLEALFRDAPRVPFWRNVFDAVGPDSSLSVWDILSRLPITSKKELVRTEVGYHADTAPLQRSDPDHTSGSTGRPFHFFFDWGASLRSYAITERILRTATNGVRFPVVYMRSRPRNGFTFWRHTWLKSMGHRDVREKMSALTEIAKNFENGFVLYAYTSSMIEVARQMEERGITLPLRAAMAAGENLLDSDRAYIERILKTELFTLYASRETGYLAYECERHALHISEEWAYIEIVDEKGRALPPGREGRIIVTTFDNRVMPFIRYDIGDRGVISDVPCDCGRTLRTITLKGRTAERIELEDGRIVALLDVSALIDRFWNVVRQFQIIQTSKSSFVLKVVPGPSFLEGKDNLKRALVNILHPRAVISWEIVEAIPEAPSGKAVYFVRSFVEGR